MISATSTTKKFSVQPVLLEKHHKTLEWLSASALWKSELSFFQKVLDDRAGIIEGVDGKKQLDHFQYLIIYYNGEVIEDIRKKLRNHENRLARMLESKSELDTQYYKEHADVMDEAQTFSVRFEEFKREVLSWAGKHAAK